MKCLIESLVDRDFSTVLNRRFNVKLSNYKIKPHCFKVKINRNAREAALVGKNKLVNT